MKRSLRLLVLLLSGVAAYPQGKVTFANYVAEAGLDAPVLIVGTTQGPGPDYTAQLLLVSANGSLTPLMPASTFLGAGTGTAAIRDRYWMAQTVEVPGVAPGNSATFIVRAWRTAAGSFENDFGNKGESVPFTVTVGGGTLPPANLIGLQSFQVGIWPEPSTFVLGMVGSGILLLWRRK